MSENHLYSVASCEKLNETISLITLRPNDKPIIYHAGQYIKAIHPDKTESLLSIANAPNENSSIQLHLAHNVNNPIAISLVKNIQQQKKILISGPYGNCTAQRLDLNRPIIFLARVTGFAPIKAIIEELISGNNYPEMYFYWSGTRPDDFYLSNLVTRWQNEIKNFHYTPVLTGSQSFADWQGETGLLQDIVLKNHPNVSDFQVYASGPPVMVHAVLQAFEKNGLQREKFFSDVVDYQD